ncbi:feather keratin 1-like [Geothlypis trichas]
MVMENKTQPGALGGIFCFEDESVGKLLSSCSDLGPGAPQEQYKSSSISSLSHPLLSSLLGNKAHLQPQAMSCYTRCQPCQPCGPTPLGSSCNEPCVRQCQDSTVAIQPSPVVVTLPGPILSSFPQNTAVGSSTSAAVGSILSSQGVPISSGGFGLSGLGSGLCGRRCFPC